MKRFSGIDLALPAVVLVASVGGFGWGWNIVKIAGANFSDITGLLVLRVIGVFVAPLGAILGYF